MPRILLTADQYRLYHAGGSHVWQTALDAGQIDPYAATRDGTNQAFHEREGIVARTCHAMWGSPEHLAPLGLPSLVIGVTAAETMGERLPLWYDNVVAVGMISPTGPLRYYTKPIIQSSPGWWVAVNAAYNQAFKYTIEPLQLPVIAERDSISVFRESDGRIRWGSANHTSRSSSIKTVLTAKGVIQCTDAFDPAERIPFAVNSDADRTSFVYNPDTGRIIKVNNTLAMVNGPVAVSFASGMHDILLGKYFAYHNDLRYELVLRGPTVPDAHEDLSERIRRRIYINGELKAAAYCAGLETIAYTNNEPFLTNSLVCRFGSRLYVGVVNGHPTAVEVSGTEFRTSSPEPIFTENDVPYTQTGERPWWDKPVLDNPVIIRQYISSENRWIIGSPVSASASAPILGYPAWEFPEGVYTIVDGMVRSGRTRHELETNVWTDRVSSTILDWNTGARVSLATLDEEIKRRIFQGTLTDDDPVYMLNGRLYVNYNRATAHFVCDPDSTSLDQTRALAPHMLTCTCAGCNRPIPMEGRSTVIYLPDRRVEGYICRVCVGDFLPSAYTPGHTEPYRPWGELERETDEDGADDDTLANEVSGFTTCCCCNALALAGTITNTEEGGACSACINTEFRACNRCGLTVRRGNCSSDGLCPRCLGGRTTLLDYNFRFAITPRKVRPSEDLFFGVEVELEHGSRESREATASNAFQVLDYPACKNFMYAKHDGSLRNGAEFVSQPFSWDWFRENKQFWVDFFGRVKERNFRADSACGLHIHVSRRPHTSLHEFRLYHLIYAEHNRDFWYRASARVGNMQYCTLRCENALNAAVWAAVARTKSTFGNRYVAMNPTNKQTLEWRLWHGVDTYDDFASALALTAASHEFVRSGAGIKPSTDKLCKFIEERHEFYCRAKSRLDLGKGLRRRA